MIIISSPVHESSMGPSFDTGAPSKGTRRRPVTSGISRGPGWKVVRLPADGKENIESPCPVRYPPATPSSPTPPAAMTRSPKKAPSDTITQSLTVTLSPTSCDGIKKSFSDCNFLIKRGDLVVSQKDLSPPPPLSSSSSARGSALSVCTPPCHRRSSSSGAPCCHASFSTNTPAAATGDLPLQTPPTRSSLPHLTNGQPPSSESDRLPSNPPSPTQEVADSASNENNKEATIRSHLRGMLGLLRDEDTLKMAVKLESQYPQRTRYLVVIWHRGTDEACLLGCDFNQTMQPTLGLVLPILADTHISLDGDGGFKVSSGERLHMFKPVSVQTMWSALQTLNRATDRARASNFFRHAWVPHYEDKIDSDQSCRNEWDTMDDLESRRPPSPGSLRNKPIEREETERLIRHKLKEVMMSVDLDDVTSKVIRSRLEAELNVDLSEYKSFIDETMLQILGQMDSASCVVDDWLYLGSEWNASNLEELKRTNTTHIVNVTREIDNFFPGLFDYINVRVYDDESTEFLKHWEKTYKLITEIREQGHRVLVHCKMGVSRSASVVIAYLMKANNWTLDEALEFVRHRRACVKPNRHFLQQLRTYQGILEASKKSQYWREKGAEAVAPPPPSYHRQTSSPQPSIKAGRKRPRFSTVAVTPSSTASSTKAEGDSDAVDGEETSSMRRASSEMMLATEDQEGGRPRDRETSSASNSPDSHRSRRRPRRLQGDDGTDPSSPPCLLPVPPSSPNDRTPSPSKEEAPFTRPKSWSSWSLHELPPSERMLRDAPRTLYLTPAHAPKAKKSSSASVPPPSPHRRPHPLDALDSRERIEVLRSGGHAYSVSRNKAFHLDISSSASTSVLLSTVMAVANEKARAAAASASAAASPPAAAARPPVPTGIPLAAIRRPSLEEAERDKADSPATVCRSSSIKDRIYELEQRKMSSGSVKSNSAPSSVAPSPSEEMDPLLSAIQQLEAEKEQLMGSLGSSVHPYEKEQIPWAAGTVKKQAQDFEGRSSTTSLCSRKNSSSSSTSSLVQASSEAPPPAPSVAPVRSSTMAFLRRRDKRSLPPTPNKETCGVQHAEVFGVVKRSKSAWSLSRFCGSGGGSRSSQSLAPSRSMHALGPFESDEGKRVLEERSAKESGGIARILRRFSSPANSPAGCASGVVKRVRNQLESISGNLPPPSSGIDRKSSPDKKSSPEVPLRSSKAVRNRARAFEAGGGVSGNKLVGSVVGFRNHHHSSPSETKQPRPTAPFLTRLRETL